ncbi:MAG: tol-pal system YbgF family protein [Fidelibacterota bacterium]
MPMVKRFLILFCCVWSGLLAGTGGLAHLKISPPNSTPDIPGYWKDRLLHRRQFHDPVKIIPLEVRYGVGIYGGGGKTGLDMKSNWLHYAQPVPAFKGGNLNGRVFHAMDIDLFKTNLSYVLLNTSWADIMSGLNVHYSKILVPNSLPVGDWGAVQSGWNVGGTQFTPRILALGMSHTLHLQWYESWFVQAGYIFDLASARFYSQAKVLQPHPSGWGTRVAYSLGWRYILDPGLDNRFSVGLEFQGGYTKINRIKDPDDVTPITRIMLPDFGLRLSLSAFYGGQRTKGDVAKSYFYRSDYVTARDYFVEFVKTYPEHANRYRAEEFIAICNARIPEQLFSEAVQFEEKGDWAKAVDRFRQAIRLTQNQELKKAADLHLDRIALIQLNRAEELLADKAPRQAYQLVKQTSFYSDLAAKSLNRFRAEVLLQDAERALDNGLVFTALAALEEAVKQYPPANAKSSALRYRAAGMLITDANQVTSQDELVFVVESLESAREITGSLGEKNETVLQALKDRLARLEDRETNRIIQDKVAQERARLTQKARRNISEGMTIPQIQDRLGSPHQLLHTTSWNGKDLQLWQYRLENGNTLFLSFEEFILFKIAEKPSQ